MTQLSAVGLHYKVHAQSLKTGVLQSLVSVTTQRAWELWVWCGGFATTPPLQISYWISIILVDNVSHIQAQVLPSLGSIIITTLKMLKPHAAWYGARPVLSTGKT